MDAVLRGLVDVDSGVGLAIGGQGGPTSDGRRCLRRTAPQVLRPPAPQRWAADVDALAGEGFQDPPASLATLPDRSPGESFRDAASGKRNDLE
jgi:hypothetical protein